MCLRWDLLLSLENSALTNSVMDEFDSKYLLLGMPCMHVWRAAAIMLWQQHFGAMDCSCNGVPTHLLLPDAVFCQLCLFEGARPACVGAFPLSCQGTIFVTAFPFCCCGAVFVSVCSR